MRRSGRRLGPWALAAALTLISASAGHAQQRGTISGQVTDVSTQQPLANIQVYVTGTALGTLTNQDGRYLLLNVPEGEAEVQVSGLGYTTATRKVTVAAGQSATADFALKQSAVALGEIVVTGTSGRVERREQPAVVSTIDASKKVERGTSTNVTDVLTAAVPGVQVTSSSGVSGTAQQIRIRGASSISLSNEPLVFVDGVRANARTLNDINIGGQGVSQLFDLNPEDIDHIEVVKGPAAATLYGADASAGVIQIFTKKGRMGAHFTQNISLEYNGIQPNWTPPANFAACSASRVGPTSSSDLCRGQPVGTVVSDNPLLRTSSLRDGSYKSLGYSGRGGGDNFGYFVSGGWDKEEGTLPNNHLERKNGRLNFNFVPTPSLSVEAGLGLGLTNRNLPINDNNIYGYMGGALLGRPYTVTTNSDGAAVGGWYIPQRDQNAIGSIFSQVETLRYEPTVQVNYTPLSWLTNRLTMGADVSRTNGTQYFPKNDLVWYNGDTDTGSLEEERINYDIYTFDYLGKASSAFGADKQYTADLSVGAQVIAEILDNVSANGTGFVTNANRVVGDASQISANQDYQKTTSVGYLSELDVGLWDRLFLQLGARVDQFSSFGENAKPFFLPKVGASYVISDEDFWQGISSLVPELRLRAAYGTTGRAPSAGASLETYEASPYAIVGGGTGAGVVPARPGNYDLRPEKGTEFEVGLDAGFLDQRIGLELTYYNKKTTDLILQVPIPPSSGFSTNPYRNIGEVLNRGWEVSLRGTPVSTPNFTWDFHVAGSTLHNELVSLGEVAAFGSLNRFQEGLPLGAFVTNKIVSIDTVAGQATVTNDLTFVGNYLPTFEGNLGSTFTIMNNVSLSGQLDWKRNFKIYNNTAQFRDRAFQNSELAVERNLGQAELIRRYGPFVNQDGKPVAYTQVNEAYIQDGGFLRLREVAATLTLPRDWAQQMKATTASLTVGGRNLALWTNYAGADPEVLAQATRNSGAATFQREDFLTIPQPRRWVVKLNLTF